MTIISEKNCIFAENNEKPTIMLDQERGLYIAHCAEGALSITGKMANRHGLIAGATGTGKTVTLQVMAETFCQIGRASCRERVL